MEYMPRKVIDKKPLTISEVMDILKERNEEENSDLSYLQRVAFEHASQNAHVSAEDSREIVEHLVKEFKLSVLSAYSVVNILPESPEELKDLLQKEPKMITEKEASAIFDYIIGYRK